MRWASRPPPRPATRCRCTIYNRAPSPEASVVLDKTWIVDGTTYAEGEQPAGLAAVGRIDGTTQGWGVPRTGFGQGDRVELNETVTIVGRPFCEITSRRLTSDNGTPVDRPLPDTVVLNNPTNRYGITNVVTCTQRLILVKEVANGSADPSTWNLRATAPTGALPGPEGTTGTDAATAEVTADVVYTLDESGGPPTYIQRASPNACPIPGSTVSWDCVEVAPDGTTVIPGFSDGLNGGVTVPLGNWVRCTAVNETAILQLRKIVNNSHGGTAVSSDFTLTATPTGPDVPAGLEPVTVTGSEVYRSFEVRPNVEYVITETGPPGYQLQSVTCEVTSGQPRDGRSSCHRCRRAAARSSTTIEPAHLTLEKTVTNNFGGTAVPTDWTLSATGPTTISGTTGSDAVTNAEVNCGHVHVGRVRRPGRVHRRRLVLHGGTVTDASVVVPLGGDVTCTIHNTEQPAHLTLIKEVDAAATGSGKVPADWTLTATPVDIDGQDAVSGNGDPTSAGGSTTSRCSPAATTLSEDGPGRLRRR